jgi:hypothetical protein
MKRRPNSPQKELSPVSPKRLRRSEDGDTLVEVLLAIVVLGLASVAILMAFATSISGSAEHRSMATLDTVERTAAEQAISQIEQQTNSQFGQCPVPDSVTFSLPSGYSATLAPAGYPTKYWSSVSSSFSTTACVVSTSTAPVVNAPQLVTIAVTNTASGVTSAPLSFVVDDPASKPLPVPAPATHLVFLTSPGTSYAGTAFGSQPIVEVEDANNNVVTSDFSAVTLTISANTPTTGGPGALSNTCQGLEFQGVVTFSGCSINTAGTGYTLTASDAEKISGSNNPLASATSTRFNVGVGAPSRLVFTTQPVGGSEATNFATEPVVTIEDTNGNVVTGDTGAVALSVGSYTSSSGGSTQGTLGCSSTTVSAVAGVATFSNCQISGTAAAGTYSLSAAQGGVSTGASSTFTIGASSATKLVFTAPASSSGFSGAAFATQPVATMEDANGNAVTSWSTSVTLGLSAQPGSGATLSCVSNPLAVVNGVAGFSGCQISGQTGNYTLSATSGGYSATSVINIAVGAPSKLIFTTAPVGNVKEATNFSTEPVVTVEDSGGNIVTSDSGSVTLSVTAYASGNGGTAQGVVGCSPTTMNAAAGVASFAGCQITGTGGAGAYTLSASRTGLTSATANISINAGTASKLGFTVQPTANQSIQAKGTGTFSASVAVQDSNGNTVQTDSRSITLAIGTNPSSGVLTCSSPSSLTAAASSGVANFTGCAITKAGSGYTLGASSSPALTAPGNANSFSIVPGAASQLITTAQPSSSLNAGATFSMGVTVEDANGNVETTSSMGSTDSIKLTLSSQSFAAGTTVVAASNGVATFPGLQITNATGSPYQIVATDLTETTATQTTTNAFTVNPTSAHQLVYLTGPQTFDVGTGTGSGSGAITVQLQDTYGNPVDETATTGLAFSALNGVRYVPSYGSTTACTTTSCAIPAGSSTGTFYMTDTSASTDPLVTSAGIFSTGAQNDIAVAGGTFPGAVVISAQNGTLAPNGTATYTITVTNSSGTNGYSELVLGGLPISATSTLSPAASTCVSIPNASHATWTLTVQTANGVTPASTSNFSVMDEGFASNTCAGAAAVSAETSGQLVIGAGPAAQLTIATAPVSGAHGSTRTIGPILVQVQDVYGNPVPVTASTVVGLASTSGTGTFASSSGGAPAATVTIGTGSSFATFFYGDTNAGSPVITVSSGVLATWSQTESVS